MPVTMNNQSFTQEVGEVSLTWTLHEGPDGAVDLDAEGSHFTQAPIASLTLGGNGKPTLDIRLPDGEPVNLFVRVGGVVKFHIADGVVTEV